MTRVVEVRTGARLHFGLFDVRSEHGRLGGIGMMIDRPAYALRVSVSSSDRDSFGGPAEARARVAGFVERLRNGVHNHKLSHASFDFEVLQAMPAHRGFGSGTQLALAVAAAVQQIVKLMSDLSLEPLGRACRSAVGSAGFFRGGFVLDPAPAEEPDRSDCGNDFPFPGVVHRTVPEKWRTVIVDPRSASGPSGTSESEAFGRLRTMSPALTQRLRDLAEREILSALDAGDFSAFAQCTSEFNGLVGSHFASEQGGIYAHPLICRLSRLLAETDWPYLAQSSWGPVAAIFCENQDSAETLRGFLSSNIPEREADIFIAAPRNRGADVVAVRSSLDES